MKSSRNKGLYLVSEVECLAPGSGAYHHIINGLKELNNYFDIDLFVINKREIPFEDLPVSRDQIKRAEVQKKSNLKRIAKWFYLLLSKNYDIVVWYLKIRKSRPEFIYERAASLSYKGLIIARLLRIPHFYEINWAFFVEQSKNYPNFLNKISRSVETWSYNTSTFCFFIGGVKNCFNLKKNNYTSIQNGIDSSFAESFRDVSYEFKNKDQIHIVFVGHAMKHHRLSFLAQAFKLVNHPEKFHLHFIGRNYEKFDLNFPDSVKTKFYGPLNHDEIVGVFTKADIGILPYAPPFSSAVKLFMYGAAGLLLIIPDVENLKIIFSKENAVFFKNEDLQHLGEVLNKIADTPSYYEEHRSAARNLVITKYLWKVIFEYQAEIMNNILESHAAYGRK